MIALPFPTNGLRIVYYHMVSDEIYSHFPRSSTINVRQFRANIRFFSRHYEVITLKDAYERHTQGYKFTKQLVVTTDDGFVQNFKTIAPVLDEYGVRATFFLIEDCLDNKILMWRHSLFVLAERFTKSKLYPLMQDLSLKFGLDVPLQHEDILEWSLRTFPMNKKEQICHAAWDALCDHSIDEYLQDKQPYLNTKQISELINNGFEMGSHTKSHPDCSKLTPDEIKEEVVESASRLSRRFNTNVCSFSFPFGRSQSATEYLRQTQNNIKIALGIREAFGRLPDPLLWERTSMEMGAFKAGLNFFLSPIRIRLKNK